jgi:hypothetical protein
MAFRLIWTDTASQTFSDLQAAAKAGLEARKRLKKAKASKQEGLFKQVLKCIDLLAANPRHPGLQTHAYSSIPHPYKRNEKVFEAYVQHRTPAAYRVFWCYGPDKGEITFLAITPHP